MQPKQNVKLMKTGNRWLTRKTCLMVTLTCLTLAACGLEEETAIEESTVQVIDDRLYFTDALYPNEALASQNKLFRLIMQTDGNLVLYAPGGIPQWSSGTYGNPGAWLDLQYDGNLVVYSRSWYPLWSSGTYGNPYSWLVMQNDGNAVLYSRSDRPLWASRGGRQP